MKKITFIILTMLVMTSTAKAQTESLEGKENLVNYTSQYSIGLLGGDAFSISFMTQHGVSISSYFETTVALGLEKYYNYRYVPMLLDFQYNILNKRTTPYVKVKGGYLLDIERNGRSAEDNYGLTIGGAIGVRTAIFEKLNVFTEIGYRYTQLERQQYYYYDWIGFAPSPVILTEASRIELRVGIGIK